MGANTGNNANDGISLGRGTRSRRAGIDYADEGIYIGNKDNQGNWGNNANTGNNANDGISLGRGTNSVSPSTSVSTSVSGGGGGSDYLSLDSAKIIAEKKGNGKASMSIDNAKALALTKIVSLTVRFLSESSNLDQTRLKKTTREMDLIYGNEWTTGHCLKADEKMTGKCQYS